MVTHTSPLDSVEDVVSFIPDGALEGRDRLNEEEIRNGHVCTCDDRHGRKDLYKGDKTAIGICENCDGYYSYVLPNHGQGYRI